MKRSTALTLGLVVAALLAVPVVGAAAAGGDVVAQQANETNSSNASVSPGERLSGVVGVQEAELEGEVDRRAFGLKVARAASDDARAQVVGEQLGDIEQRLKNLSAQKEALDEARENGSISQGEYAAKVSELAARGQTASDLANDTNETAGELPREVLEANGVNVSAIQQLRSSASELTGPEVAAIAQSIAGPNVGKAPQEVPAGGPADAGPGERGEAGNATDGESADTPDGTDTSGTDTPDGTTTQDGTDTDTGTATEPGAGGSSDEGSRGGSNR